METIIICLSNLLCFITGAVIGQKVVRQEKIELNPVKVVKNTITEHKVQKEKEAEDEYIKTILHNIDVYDGTSVGQIKVPTRK